MYHFACDQGGEHYPLGPLKLSVLKRWGCIIFKMAQASAHFCRSQTRRRLDRTTMDGHGNLCRINHWTPHQLMVEPDKPGRTQVLRGAFFSFSCTDIPAHIFQKAMSNERFPPGSRPFCLLGPPAYCHLPTLCLSFCHASSKNHDGNVITKSLNNVRDIRLVLTSIIKLMESQIKLSTSS